MLKSSFQSKQYTTVNLIQLLRSNCSPSQAFQGCLSTIKSKQQPLLLQKISQSLMVCVLYNKDADKSYNTEGTRYSDYMYKCHTYKNSFQLKSSQIQFSNEKQISFDQYQKSTIIDDNYIDYLDFECKIINLNAKISRFKNCLSRAQEQITKKIYQLIQHKLQTNINHQLSSNNSNNFNCIKDLSKLICPFKNIDKILLNQNNQNLNKQNSSEFIRSYVQQKELNVWLNKLKKQKLINLEFCNQQYKYQQLQNNSYGSYGLKNQQNQYSNQLLRLNAQTDLLLEKILNKYKKINSKQKFNQKILVQQFQKVLKWQLIYNCILICYEIRNIDQGFNLDYYGNLYLQNFLQLSAVQKKVQFFWYSLQNKYILKRFFLQFKPDQQNQTEYRVTIIEYLLTENQINDIKEKRRYIIHFCQFFHDIITQFSSQEHITMASTFNVVRFVILELLSIFVILSIKRIKLQIKQKLGSLYYQLFERSLSKDIKYTQCQQRIYQALELSSKKLQQYDSKANVVPPVQQKNVNPKKLLKLLQNQKLRLLYKKINTRQKLDKFIQIYSFQKVKQVYSVVINIIFQQFFNMNIFLRTIKLMLRQRNTSQQFNAVQKMIRESNKNLLKNNNVGQKNVFLQLIKINIKKQDDNIILLCKQKRFSSLLSKISIPMIEMYKILSMTLSLPFYSYQTQRTNWFRQHKIIQQRDYNFDRFFKNIDFQYIYIKSRFNTKYMSQNQQEIIHGIYQTQMKMYYHMVLFAKSQNLEMKKQHLIPKSQTNEKIPQEKRIHQDRMSIYNDEELKFFNQLLTPKSTDLDKESMQNFKNFFAFTVSLNKFRNFIIEQTTQISKIEIDRKLKQWSQYYLDQQKTSKKVTFMQPKILQKRSPISISSSSSQSSSQQYQSKFSQQISLESYNIQSNKKQLQRTIPIQYNFQKKSKNMQELIQQMKITNTKKKSLQRDAIS